MLLNPITQSFVERIESLVSLIAGHIGSSAAVEKNGTQNGTATRETNTKIEHAVTGNNSSTTTIHNASIPSWKNETLFATEVGMLFIFQLCIHI